MPARSLYDDDFHAWALGQAERLRAVAKSQAPELEGLDVERLSEEIENLAGSVRRNVESRLEMALRLILMIGCFPKASSAKNQSMRVNSALYAAHDGYCPSMRDHIDFDRLWRVARKRALRDLRQDGLAVPVTPARNPFHLNQLLNEDLNVDGLVETFMAVLPDVDSGMLAKD